MNKKGIFALMGMLAVAVCIVVSVLAQPAPIANVTTANEETIIFDTGPSSNPYPSIAGTHKGTITPAKTLNVSKIFTYPCEGTGGHSEYVQIYGNGVNETVTWGGYSEEWHKLSFNQSFLLAANKTYYYEIKTGSYPQIHHTDELKAEEGMGIINCTSFVDANGRSHNHWIPAIRLVGYFVDGEGVHNQNTGENFTTIQAAIEDSDTQDGHTIVVYAGTYVENVNVTKRLTLRGIGMPTVDANGTESAITVSVDGCVVDGFNVTGASTDSKSDYYAGIKVTSSGNTLSNNTATNNNYGIFLLRSSNNTLTNNIANSNYWYGIYLAGYPSGSSNNILAGNIANWNNYYGIGLKYSNNNTIEENKVSSNNYEGIYVLSNSCNNNINSNTLSNNSVGIAISRGKGNNIRGNTVFLNSKGIIISSRHNNITENTVYSNEYGIDIRRENNNVTRNTVSSNSVRGIGISRAYNNVIENNVSSNNLFGISIGILTRYNNISGNTVSNHIYGVFMSDCLGWYTNIENVICNNTISKNVNGVYIARAQTCPSGSYSMEKGDFSCLIYRNNLISNGKSAYDETNANLWDNGPINGGNYWSDHECTGNPSDGGQPYNITGDAGAQDRYPFEDIWGWR